MSRLPNFIMIGAAKCGSTSLYHYVVQHPQVYMSPIQDLNFFALEDGRYVMNMPPGAERHAARYAHTLAEYLTHFEGVTNETAVGESSNIYINASRIAAERIHAHIPAAKLIAILRNPADRAFSNYLHLAERNLEPAEDFEEALKREPERIREQWHPMWFYKDTGFYHRNLKPFFEIFGRDQIGIFLFDDLSRDRIALVQSIFSFLAVDNTFTPNVSGVHKATGIPRSKLLYDFLKKRNPVKSALKAIFPQSTREKLRTSSKHLLRRTLRKPEFPPQIRKQLIDEYADDIRELQRLIGKDLSPWFNTKV